MLLADVLAENRQAAVEAAKGTSYVDAAGTLLANTTLVTLSLSAGILYVNATHN